MGASSATRPHRAVCPALLTAFALFLPAANARASADSSLGADRIEFGALPVLGGDVDVGLKFGTFVQVVQYRDGLKPYAWRTQVLLATSALDGATGLEFPYREVNVRLDFPHLWDGRLRLLPEVAYLQTTNLGYYGLGNQSRAAPVWEGLARGTDAFVQARRSYQFDATTPLVRAAALYRLATRWQAFGAATLRWVAIRTYADSRLAQDIATGAGAGERLRGTDDHLEPLVSAGLVYDTRDHETVPTSGIYSDASVRCSPGALAYCGANVTLRAYASLAGERVTLAARVLGDVLSKDAPLMELTNFANAGRSTSLTGTCGIRGVPRGRLAGRTKVLGNLELRSFFLPFALLEQRFTLGAAAFADAGRVWTDAFRFVPSLDGASWRVHWSAGGGPRLRWGDGLVIRADVAWAPLGAQLGSAPGLYVEVEAVL